METFYIECCLISSSTSNLFQIQQVYKNSFINNFMKMKVVILAAGRGERLKPITDKVPKAMVEINKKPILEYIIENFKKVGFKSFILVVGYKKEVIVDYFGDGSRFDVNIEYVDQGAPQGTGHAVLITRDKTSDDFIVCNSDSILDSEEIKIAVKNFKENNLDCIIGVKNCEKEEIINLGNVLIENNRVVDIIEKPSVENCVGNAAFTGFAIFKRNVYSYLENLPKRFNGQDGLPDAIRLMAKDGKAVGVEFIEVKLHLTREEDIERISEIIK
ncbi:hypothetical protein A3K64_01385 [Candidatus Micrarchaeota archaeon RBG_16_36_9]|nr:MAG: hypothetical protein A3K64_01385 [Candidatus Micrarchaeota archaeon RBG_16_36_9]